MTTTRINHTGHAHANTTAARTACRKAMKTAPVAVELVPVAMVGRGNAVHAATLGTDGSLYGVDCGAGMSRSASRGTSSFRRLADAPATAITCAKCAKH